MPTKIENELLARRGTSARDRRTTRRRAQDGVRQTVTDAVRLELAPKDLVTVLEGLVVALRTSAAAKGST
jgi:hypothetical protein